MKPTNGLRREIQLPPVPLEQNLMTIGHHHQGISDTMHSRTTITEVDTTWTALDTALTLRPEGDPVTRYLLGAFRSKLGVASGACGTLGLD